jgi:hypothetical protein
MGRQLPDSGCKGEALQFDAEPGHSNANRHTTKQNIRLSSALWIPNKQQQAATQMICPTPLQLAAALLRVKQHAAISHAEEAKQQYESHNQPTATALACCMSGSFHTTYIYNTRLCRKPSRSTAVPGKGAAAAAAGVALAAAQQQTCTATAQPPYAGDVLLSTICS